jgi:hypothetical protein
LFQKIKQSQRAGKGIRAPIRENPRTRASKNSGVRRRCFKFRAGKSGNSSFNVMESSSRRQGPLGLYRKFRSDPIFQFYTTKSARQRMEQKWDKPHGLNHVDFAQASPNLPLSGKQRSYFEPNPNCPCVWSS